ncbi:H-NS family nucleoid-associated regulatory protein [Desulfamplus magnetovallimortis]|uniref:H-NS family nucleoid-associated regulatory protein n=1 Tax=Desulfamplus magnetovallimortis TaxID=1246637 RepID=UPI001FE4705A|nr:H-NS family nucleoid-associated regulatory protein [Desulfamplus magnetovallimortis]
MDIDEVINEIQMKNKSSNTNNQNTTKNKKHPIYRSLINKEKTWSGVGRKPEWFKKENNNGTTIEELKIKNQDENKKSNENNEPPTKTNTTKNNPTKNLEFENDNS